MSIYFTHHEGETQLSSDEKEGLIPKHIESIHDLDLHEQRNIQNGLNWLKKHSQSDPLTVEFVLKLHQHLFGDVWNWAGTYRRTEKNIGIDPFQIPSELYKLLDNTHFWISASTYPWYEILARFHHRFVQIHPFVNGNGRVARILVEHLCLKHGNPIPNWRSDIQEPDKRRKLYLDALRRADLHHFDLLTQFLSVNH